MGRRLTQLPSPMPDRQLTVQHQCQGCVECDPELIPAVAKLSYPDSNGFGAFVWEENAVVSDDNMSSRDKDDFFSKKDCLGMLKNVFNLIQRAENVVVLTIKLLVNKKA